MGYRTFDAATGERPVSAKPESSIPSAIRSLAVVAQDDAGQVTTVQAVALRELVESWLEGAQQRRDRHAREREWSKADSADGEVYALGEVGAYLDLILGAKV